MTAKRILIICLFISMLFSLASKAMKPGGSIHEGNGRMPGEIVSPQTIRKLGERHFFSISPIPDDIFRLMQGKTYKKNCSVARSELRYLRCLHVDKDGRKIVGEMVVNKAIAADVLDILKKTLRGEISDRANEAHRLLGCRRREGDESQQLIQLQLPLHLAYPYRFEAWQRTCHRYQHALQPLPQTAEKRQGSGGASHGTPLSRPQ